MKKLLSGIVEFRKNLTEERKKLFAQLALGQKPDALFIGCSDSRVVPNLFASTEPGDLLVVRNIGNLVPPAAASPTDISVAAALEFAVHTLKVENIIVCGHSECGAMIALANKHASACNSCMAHWLQHGKRALYAVQTGSTCSPMLSEHNQVSQANVLVQMEHITTYPFVREKIEQGLLQVHGWWFDIAEADVYCYEESLHRFVIIDEHQAEVVLRRLG